jgi:hypothetical protein
MIASKKSRSMFNKETKDLCNENCKSLKKEIEECIAR